jgi:hypothetical protein
MGPKAEATGSLYVSAENEQFGNTFGGAQIVGVVVLGHAMDTDVSAGEPTVKVYENLLRMAQGTDGNWYGYFGDLTAVPAADTATNNLDFGVNNNPINLGLGEASDIFLNATSGVIKNPPALSSWNNTVHGQSADNSVAGIFGVGQIGILDGDRYATNTDEWPFIQLYDFTIETFDVVYEQAGADEVVTLNYNSGDLDDFAGMELDRNAASQESDIHLTITDNQLNIDPTAEDIIIFDVTTDSEGMSFTARSATDTYNEWSNSFDDNGKLIINYKTQSAGKDVLINKVTGDDATADKKLVFFEYGENSGIFVITDDKNVSN